MNESFSCGPPQVTSPLRRAPPRESHLAFKDLELSKLQASPSQTTRALAGPRQRLCAERAAVRGGLVTSLITSVSQAVMKAVGRVGASDHKRLVLAQSNSEVVFSRTGPCWSARWRCEQCRRGWGRVVTIFWSGRIVHSHNISRGVQFRVYDPWFLPPNFMNGCSFASCRSVLGPQPLA